MLRFSRRISLLLVPALLAVFMAGCTGSNDGEDTSGTGSGTATGDSAKPAGSRGKIGFSALTLKNPFFKIIADSMTAEAERHGFEVIVNDAERDVNEQAKHIDNYIAQNVAAIVLNPADRIAIGPAVKKANEAGIPVFTCDLQCVSDDAKITGHVGTDNYQGGELAGKAMVEVLGDAGGEVLILHFKQANSCVLRVEGFMKIINDHNKGRDTGKITIAAELDGGGLQDEGYRATADALQAHPNLAGIFAINDPSGLGAWRALKDVNKDDQVTIIGFDGQLEGKQAILEGKFYADPIQFPNQMGIRTVENIVKFLDGEEFEEITLIPTELYTKADAENDADLQSLNKDATDPGNDSDSGNDGATESGADEKESSGSES